MKIAIFGDVHANIEALDAVLLDIKDKGIKEKYCLGDIVGYGPNPRECLETVRDNCNLVLQGNHEAGVIMKWGTPAIGLVPYTGFSASGSGDGIRWAIHQLCHDNTPAGDDNYTKELIKRYQSPDFKENPIQKEAKAWIDYMKSLKTEARVDNALFVHDNPFKPGIFPPEYTHPSTTAKDSESHTVTTNKIYSRWDELFPDVDFIFTAHLHEYFMRYKDKRVIVNIGTVGMPRNKRLKGTYVIWDTSKKGPDAVKFRHYPLPKWQITGEKMEKAGLPNKLKKVFEEGAPGVRD